MGIDVVALESSRIHFMSWLGTRPLLPYLSISFWSNACPSKEAQPIERCASPVTSYLLQLMAVLSKVDNWQFDAFELDVASEGWPLSCLAFSLITRMKRDGPESR